ncbi:MAG TPA: YceI family protein [Candidatus Baltobacteraceae bacterium]
MRRFFFALALLLSVASLARGSEAVADATVRAIDPALSRAQFSIQHIFVDRVTGTIPIRGGVVTFTAGSPIPVSVTAVLDASAVQTDDPDRDNALRSADYFDTKAFPTWNFASTKIEPAGVSAFGMDGLLTIHGVSQAEHLDVVLQGDAFHPIYQATGHIDRHAFGMKGARLDPVIGNTADVTLKITLQP